MAKKTIIIMTAWMMSLGFSAGDAKAFSIESGSYNTLNLDSGKDILNISQTVSDAVNEVLRDLVPTDLINTPTNIPFNVPLNPLGHVKTISTSLPGDGLNFTQYFNQNGISTNDLGNTLKGVAVLSVQIFVVVVQVVWQIVQGIQGALNS